MTNAGLAAILCSVTLAGTGVGAAVLLGGGEPDAPSSRIVAAQAPIASAGVAIDDDDDDDDDDEHDVNVTLDQVTEAARATILEYAKDGEITEIEMSRWRGEVVYEIEVYWDDTETDFMVGADGAFLGYEEED